MINKTYMRTLAAKVNLLGFTVTSEVWSDSVNWGYFMVNHADTRIKTGIAGPTQLRVTVLSTKDRPKAEVTLAVVRDTLESATRVAAAIVQALGRAAVLQAARISGGDK